MDDTSTCPTQRDADDEVAHQWVAGVLAPDAAIEFEAHLHSCTGCQRAVERAAGITAALRAAAASHTPTSPMRRWATAVADQARAFADTIRQARPR